MNTSPPVARLSAGPGLVALLLVAGGCVEYKLSTPDDVPPGDSASDDTAAGDTAPDDSDPPDCEDLEAPATPSPGQDESCLAEPGTGSFDPVVEWNSDDDIVFAEASDFKHPYVMPTVANLTDDDGDGDIDADDVPDVVYSAFSTSDTSHGRLRVLSGDGVGEVLSIGQFSHDGATWAITRFAGSAVADLENDGSPDIITIVQPLDSDSSCGVAAFEADGTPKWVYFGEATSRYSYPSVADLDQDGDAEVVVGHIVLDTDGSELGVGAGGTATPDSNPSPTWGSISVPVDLDGDGTLEIVAGNTVYAPDGSTLAESGRPDGFCAVGDLDLDGQPEIVTTVHSTGEVYAWEADGTVMWNTATGSGGGGSPTIADFDADGEPEIGVAGKTAYSVLEGDGTVIWTAGIVDNSSSATGSSVFDFDSDGAAEVVFADEESFVIFDGATGAVLHQQVDHVHGTAWEYPVIVDVDHDDAAEIVFGSTNSSRSGWNGITVIGDASDSWAPARPVWNQHAYHITNIDSDGGVPAVQQDNWLTWNNFRAGGTELGPSHWLADLVPDEPSICTETCALDEVTLYLSLGNRGLLDASVFTVRLVQSGTGTVVLDETVAGVTGGNGTVLGPFTLSRDDWGDAELHMRVDSADEVEECDETDNAASLGAWPCE